MINLKVKSIPIPSIAKWAFSTRRVIQSDVTSLDKHVQFARAGDLVLCEIVKVGQHKRIQLASQRVSKSYKGDLLVACVGDRYAPDQFMGRAEITSEHADLLAGGGVVGTVEIQHSRMSDPTKLRPIGLLVNKAGEVLNVANYALPAAQIPDNVTVLGVFGASMNAGKTTAAVSLAHGLRQAGFQVAGVKATGTGSFGDFNAFEDAGIPALDFTDAGMPTTFRMPIDRIEEGFRTLVGTAACRGAEIVVVEIADGVFQKETAALLEGSAVRDRLDGILFASPDALSAVGGYQLLRSKGLTPFAFSGMVSCSALATKEVKDEIGLPVATKEILCDPAQVMQIAGPSIQTRADIFLNVA